jgi:N-acetylglucosaminyldiphosphoundecaprenol N-acetyl-beta-D-mannosaminyltransferase
MEKVELFNIRFDNFDFEDLMHYLDSAIEERKPTYVLTCNVDHLIDLRKDSHFRKVYEEAGATVADGMPIVWVSKWLGTPLKCRVAGSDILPELGLALERKRYRIYFLGAQEGVAEEAKQKLLLKFPALHIVGCCSPPLGFEHDQAENARIVQLLIDAKPDIVFVGLGAPKQEKWIHRYHREYGAPVSIGVGGTFDFLAGRVKRAPLVFQRAGMEWLWRLFQEPKRLWSRYLVKDTKFVKLVLSEMKIKRRRQRHGAYSKRG